MTRGDCKDDPRPCPWVGCRHHLYLETYQDTGLKLRNDGKEPWELEHSCSLDVADAHPDGMVLDDIGAIMGITRERIRQVESAALKRSPLLKIAKLARER